MFVQVCSKVGVATILSVDFNLVPSEFLLRSYFVVNDANLVAFYECFSCRLKRARIREIKLIYDVSVIERNCGDARPLRDRASGHVDAVRSFKFDVLHGYSNDRMCSS